MNLFRNPVGAIFGSATPDQGSCNEALGVVTCNLGTITAGQSVIITIMITPTVVGTASNNVTVVSEVDDPDPADNSDDEDTEVDPAPTGPPPTADPGPSDPPESPVPGPVINSIPTLSGWASMLMPLLLVLISATVLWRRDRRKSGST